MVKCWAKSLGDCDNVQSREHYLSKGLWEEDEITVEGLWDEPRTIRLETLVAKNLCKEHNERLSPLDSEAKHVFQTIAELYRLHNLRAALDSKQKWSSVKYRVSGPLFEQWTAKFLVGIFYVFGKQKLWHLTQTGPLDPPSIVVEAIYGHKPFSEPMGLYLAYDVGDIHYHEGAVVTIWPLFHSSDQGLVGSLLKFRGFQFVTWLSTEDPRTFNVRVSNRTFGPGGSTLTYHPAKHFFRINKAVSQTLEFTW